MAHLNFLPKLSNYSRTTVTWSQLLHGHNCYLVTASAHLTRRSLLFRDTLEVEPWGMAAQTSVLPFPWFHYVVLDSSLMTDTAAAAEEEEEEEYKKPAQMEIFTLVRDCAGMG